MKRFLAVIALGCAAALPAACGPDADTPAAAETPAPVEAAAPASTETTTPTAPAAAPAATGGEPAAAGAPAFAVLYPGATLDAPAVVASSATGPGGLATYTTDADPDAVIAFHRGKAEAAGLTTSMAMNQGDARAYGATSADGDANLQVVASAVEPGRTSVQISWIAGR
ncbi:hypothetical protein ACETK8_04215 [Brevundimonas staleyi]|uniref:Lipoprotein n=1 Tax=Brevundimonas staleyi TaxID=74326 RepID=A0ABW0FW01_9CAUL